MNCNCNNNGINEALTAPEIKHVFGNVLKLAIPLTLREITVEDGEVEYTDTDFIPSSEYPVIVVFGKGAVNIHISAVMRDGNVAYIEEKGKIPIGVYSITVMCNDEQGNPYRFKQNMVLQVVDTTKEAGITTPIEYETRVWYLNAALFIALKGEDGVGIADIVTESSGEIGGMNYITFVLTDGRTRTFTILNGSGTVDQEFNTTSPQPIANSVVSTKFNEVDAKISNLFGDVDYDSTSKTIRFWDKGKTKVLATIDARPFIKDGMVSNVYISGTTLVVTFNTDAGHEAIGVPLQGIFNPNNYYTRTQVNNLLNNYYTDARIDAFLDEKADVDDVYTKNEVYTQEEVRERLTLCIPVRVNGNVITSTKGYAEINNAIKEDMRDAYVIVNNNIFYQLHLATGDSIVFTNVDVEEGVQSFLSVNQHDVWSEESRTISSGGGMQATYSNGTITFTGSGSSQPTYSNGTITL